MSLLGLDVGMSSVKGVAFSREGSVLATGSRTYSFLFPHPGWVELDPQLLETSIQEIIRGINTEVRGDPVQALSVCSFGEGFTAIDGRGTLLTNFILNIDVRADDEYREIVGRFGENALYRTTGLRPASVWSVPKMLWLKRHWPDIYHSTYRFLFGEDFIYRLLGLEDTALSYSTSSKTMCYDLVSRSWARSILEELELDIDKLSRPTASGTVAGFVDSAVAEPLGFAGKVAVVVGGHDQACAALGVGAFEEGIACDSIGTVECLAPVFARPIQNRKMYAGGYCCEPHVVADRFITNGINITAGSVLSWFGRTFNGPWKYGFQDKDSNYGAMFEPVDHRPSKLSFFPYFTTSSNHFSSARPLGAVIGLSLSSDPTEILKAIVEGLILEIKMHVDRLRLYGARIDELRATGGGSRSRYWLQLKANILSMPISTLAIDEAGCLGGAILAGVAIGVFADISEAERRLVRVSETFFPEDSFDSGPYLEKERTYRKMFRTLLRLLSPDEKT